MDENRAAGQPLGKNDCAVCKKVVRARDPGMHCNKCSCWYHIDCISMTPADYSILKQTVKVKNAMWFCDKCVGSFNSNNQADNSELLERLKTLEHTIETLTKSLTTLQGGQLSYDEKFDSIVESKVKDYLDEKQEQDKRKLNLIVNGIEESTDEDSTVRIAEDRSKVESVLNAININSNELTHKCVRLGAKSPRYQSRLLLISLSSTKIRSDIMKAQVEYRAKHPNKKIYFSPDRSPKQREENKKMVVELKKRRDEGENVRIKGGSIISLDHRGAPRNIGAPNTGN